MEEEPARIAVKVQPDAGRNEMLRYQDGVWFIKIAALPVKGKANRELIEFLSHILGVSRSCLSIEKGLASRQKVISISGLTQGQVVRQLESLVRLDDFK